MHESATEVFVEHLVREAGSLVIGECTVDGGELGPVVFEFDFDRVRGHLLSAQQHGVRVAVTGPRLPDVDNLTFHRRGAVLLDRRSPAGAEASVSAAAIRAVYKSRLDRMAPEFR